MTDLDKLKDEHPGWDFGTVWTTAATGPDYRRLWAQRGTVLLTAQTVPELTRDIRREEEGA